MISKDQKIYILQYDDVSGDFLRAQNGKTPSAVKIKQILKHILWLLQGTHQINENSRFGLCAET